MYEDTATHPVLAHIERPPLTEENELSPCSLFPLVSGRLYFNLFIQFLFEQHPLVLDIHHDALYARFIHVHCVRWPR